MARILIIDDEASIGWGIRQLATKMGHEAVTAATAEKGLEVANELAPHLIFLDVRLPGMDGLTAMRQFQQTCGSTPIVIMTAFGELETAVTAVQQGAFEYLVKPFNMRAIEEVMRRALMFPDPMASSDTSEVDTPHLGGIVGTSQSMQEAFKRIALAAATDAPILISGASGTGKELAARAIHENGKRRNGPFVTVNIASLTETLAESELFGHVQGSFTGANENRIGYMALADGGTLFLDEVAEIPLPLQVKLLRVVESGEVFPVGASQHVVSNFRIIAATHQSLLERIKLGAFRSDLYFRLAAFQIEMPDLASRNDDIELLAQHFIESIARREAAPAPRLSQETIDELLRRSWPGNVRELRNAIEHAMIVSRGAAIDPSHLPPAMHLDGTAASDDGSIDAQIRLLISKWASERLSDETVGDLYADLMKVIEPPLLEKALESNQSQYVAAAKALGIHRTTLRKKTDEYGIDPLRRSDEE